MTAKNVFSLVRKKSCDKFATPLILVYSNPMVVTAGTGGPVLDELEDLAEAQRLEKQSTQSENTLNFWYNALEAAMVRVGIRSIE